MSGVQTKKALKAAQDAAYLSRVTAALGTAHRAAKLAAESFIKQAPKTPEGFVKDLCGGASVIIYKPSYRFREALEALRQIRSGYCGAWFVSHFTKDVHSQSVQANEAAAQAARAVLEHEFPEEPNFYCHTYLS